MEELNYYELLDLDPAVEDNEAIERRLQDRQRLWSRQTTEGTPKDARVAARNLKLLDQIRRTLQDPTSRADMAAEARLRKEQRAREARARLSDLLAFAKDKIDDVDAFISRDCAKYVRELGRAEVLRLVTAAGITPGAARAAQAPATRQIRRETLEPTTAKRIRDGLEHLGKADLYDFLGLTRRCTAQSLCAKAELLNKNLLQSGRSDDKTTASKELAGQCMALFSTATGKERYNNTLADQRLDDVLRDFLALAGKEGSIGAKDMANLLAIASRQGIAPTDAAPYIRAMAQRRRWTLIEGPVEPIASPLPLCGYCGCLARSENDLYCWNCNRKLKIRCPRCGKELLSSQTSCTECGTNIEDAEIVEACFKEARQALDANDPDTAQEQITRCLTLWPDWSEATNLQKRIEQKRHQQQAIAQQLITLLRERRMFAAQECIELAKKESGPKAYARASDIVNKSLTDANRMYLEGTQHKREGRVHEAGQCFEQALSLCADMEQALEGLRQLPSIPPTDLQAVPLGQNAVRLSWKSGKNGALFEYTLVRKAHGAPASPDDGLSLLSSGATTFDDTLIQGGIDWYYSVFSLRRGVPSTQPVSLGPIFLTPPVQDFTALPEDGQARLQWTLPPNAAGAEVRRSQGAAPRTLEEGERVPLGMSGETGEFTGLTLDKGLENGKIYHYAAFALYADPLQPAVRRCSPPVVCRLIPSPVLEPVTDLVCFCRDDMAYLRWTPPPSGTVCLLCTLEELPCEQNQMLPLNSLGRYGDFVPPQRPGSAAFQLAANDVPGASAASLSNEGIPDPATQAGRLRFVPLTTQGHLAVPGIPCAPTPMPEVGNIVSRTCKGALELHWDWPDGVDETLICWSTTRYPTDIDCIWAAKAVCSRADYEHDNGFAIDALIAQKHFILVYARIPGQNLYSAGTRHFSAMGLLDVVRYRVRRNGLLRKRANTVELQTETIETLTGILLRGKEGCIPLTIHDGVPITRIESLTFKNHRAEIQVPPRFRQSRLYVKLFLDNPELAQSVRLMPAKTDELKLW